MQVKIKKLHENAVIPQYAMLGDAGLDLTATSEHITDNPHQIKYGTGLAIEIPKGYVGLVFPRSSIFKKNQFLTNCVGVIDSNYRGEIFAVFEYTDELLNNKYKIGDRIAQLLILPYPQVEFLEVSELEDSNRGSNGFGSTGN